MKPIKEFVAGVWPALLTAALLLGSACTVEVDDPEDPDDLGHTAETDDMLHVAPEQAVDDAKGDDGGQLQDVEGFGQDARCEQGQLVLPGVNVAEPEPDPWDDPMSSGQGSGSSNNND